MERIIVFEELKDSLMVPLQFCDGTYNMLMVNLQFINC